MLAIPVLMWLGRARSQPLPASALPTMSDAIASFPPPRAELPIATPLAPLLAADLPEDLAVLSPGEGAARVRRGESYEVRFNRPMVRGVEVGRALATSPIVLTPRVPGTARWITRSTLAFTPDASAFDHDRQASVGFAEGLGSVDGDAVVDETPRVMVLDGTPRLLSAESSAPVGAPLMLTFDAPVRTNDLARELFVYEQGGGYRALPVQITNRGAGPDEGQFLVSLQPSRLLEPGARIAIAVAPRWMSWGGSHPSVMEVQLEPRPRVDGVLCSEYEWGGTECSYDASPGAILDIETELTVRATHPLGEVAPSLVRVTPPVEGLHVEVRGGGSDARRLLAVTAEWDPDQVYEVRLGELYTERGERLVRTVPYAVRAAGHPPSVSVRSGTFPMEADATLTWPFRAIHVDQGRALVRSVAPGDEVRALAHPEAYALAAPEHTTPLLTLAPSSRPNRWGPGAITIEGSGPRMQVVALQPGTEAGPGNLRGALFVASDLGVTATAVPSGVLVWVTSIAHGTPVGGASVALSTIEGLRMGNTRTGDDGTAWLDVDEAMLPALQTHAAIVVSQGDDRTVVDFDPRLGVGPATLAVTGGTGTSDDGAVRATVISDRGAYRPEETLHALAIVRRVEGATLTVPPRRAVTLRLLGPSSAMPVGVASVPVSAAGVASASFTLESDAVLGDYVVEAVLDDHVVGSASVTVSEYREPRFRVDLEAPADRTVAEGDPLHVGIHGRYLFGAPLARASARYTIVRGGAIGHGARWHELVFAPVSAHAARTTLSEGSLDLDAHGEGAIDGVVSLGIPTRTALDVEVEVTDESGESTTAHRRIVARPAEIEVGVQSGDGWSALGRPIVVQALALDASDEPIVGAALEARVVRESQQGYYEWEESDDGGGFRLRHTEGTEVVHRCALRSAAELVSCSYTPERAGSYVLEVEARDTHGRRSLASRRVYVSGPDGAPDRDPPGSPVELTPDHERYVVGDTAEIAFESPYAGRAMLTVQTDGVLARQALSVVAGGNRVRVPVTDRMVPNAFVSIAIVRPRTGPPPSSVEAHPLDLDAPDLRFGGLELRAVPRADPLTVAISAAPSALPGSEVPIDVQVASASGAAEHGVEVALWAVDEGTLRVTDWQLPDATSGLFVRRAARFAMDDVRRTLASRLPGALEPGPSGDGGFVDAVMQLASRERYEPTPLFTTTLVTDAEGHARTSVTLPDRVTEYRLVAVAVQGAGRFGRSEGSLVATRPVVVRPALPRFLTEGDEVELAAFVHDESSSPVDATVVVRAFGAEQTLGPVHVLPGADVRVTTRVTVPIGAEPTPIEMVARTSAGDEHHVSRTLDVMPRGRWVRERALVSGTAGVRDLPLTFPEGTSVRGALRAVASLHPFIAADGLADDLASLYFGGGEIDAAVVLGLASHVRLGGTVTLRDSESAEREGIIRRRLRRLSSYTTESGGYSMQGTWATADARLTIAVLRARVAAGEAGILPDEGPAHEATERAGDALLALVRSGQVGADYYGYGPGNHDLLAQALYALSLVDRRDDATFTREFDGRDLLSPQALAFLALAAEEGDRRRDALVVLALGRFHTDHGITFATADTTTLSALLVAAASTPAGHTSVARIAGVLLDRAADGRASLYDPFSTAQVIDAFAHVADRFVVEGATAPTLALDATQIPAAETAGVSARFAVPFAQALGGTHSLVARGSSDRPVFLALESRWAEPLTAADDDARGRALTLHRVVETPNGAPIPSGSHLPLGSLVRVRLFLHTESTTPEWSAVRDPHPAGLEPVDDGLASSPSTEIASLVGMGPDDDVVDVRARRALESVAYVRSHEHAPHASTYQLTALGPGLYELTYALRASTPGTFVAPPASFEALRDPDVVARSETFTVTVDP